MTQGQRKAHAFHEAGHVVVAIAVQKIKIIEVNCEDCAGTTKVEWESGGINFEKLCFYLAGEMAESAFAEEHYSEKNSRSDRLDTQSVLFLLSHDRNVQYRFWLSAIAAVREMLNDPVHAKRIQTIANALMERDFLTGKEIENLISE